MRARFTNRKRNQGSVLAVTMLICGILCFLMGSYLYMLKTHHLLASRSQAWNAAIVVAEAGVEEAMAQLNAPGVTTNNLAVNSWSQTGNGVYSKTNFLGTSYYIVAIEIAPFITNPYPIIVSTGFVAGPVSTPTVQRAVQIATRGKPVLSLPSGMVVKTMYDAGGSGVAIDSYNPYNTNYSTGGIYDPAKPHDQAQLISLTSSTNSILVDNSKIRGTLHTAPGGSYSTGANGSVGDSAWVSGKTKGVEAGHFADDTSAVVPDVTLPDVSSWLTPTPGSYKINGVTYKYVLNNSSAWQLSSLTDSVYINAPNVILYVSDALTIGTGQQIHIGANASVSMYVGAAKATIGGKGIINDTGMSKNYVYYGLPSNTQISFGANSTVTGIINAPEAQLGMNGGGTDNYDFMGACIVNAVVMGGHFNFHYDESVPTVVYQSGYVVSSWDELNM